MVQSTQTVKHLYWTTELSQFNWRQFKCSSTASISSVGQFHIEKGEISHSDEYFMCFQIRSGLKFCGGRTSSVFTLLYIPERLHSVQSSKFGRIYVLNQLQIHKWDENHPLQGIPGYCVALNYITSNSELYIKWKQIEMPHGHAPLQLFPWLVKHERSNHSEHFTLHGNKHKM